jgi:hypothetical protein
VVSAERTPPDDTSEVGAVDCGAVDCGLNGAKLLPVRLEGCVKKVPRSAAGLAIETGCALPFGGVSWGVLNTVGLEFNLGRCTTVEFCISAFEIFRVNCLESPGVDRLVCKDDGCCDLALIIGSDSPSNPEALTSSVDEGPCGCGDVRTSGAVRESGDSRLPVAVRPPVLAR